MRFKLIIPLIVFMFLLTPITALASDGIAITVVVPPQEQTNTDQAPAQPDIPLIFPVSVWESRENGRREIMRVYELTDSESPAHIPREPFERDGFRFELAEITRREMPLYSTKEFTETVTVSTQTNDLATVIRLLSPTLEYICEDGYFGILALEIGSIKIESAGTRTTSHTETRTREYPHLSSADTSLVPRAISENGSTFNLQNVDWNTQSTAAVDYTEIPASYTAVATYTRSASRTAVTGYNTTAEYTGTLSRIAAGKTEFTAAFIGIPIVTPTVTVNPGDGSEECDEAVAEDKQDIIADTDTDTDADIETATDEETTANAETEDTEKSNLFTVIGLALLFLISVTLAFFAGRKGISMLKGAKKLSCLVVCVLMALTSFQTAHAAQLPGYGFGRSDTPPAVHYDTRTANASSDPPIIHGAARESPANIYNYGDFLGTLTVGRLNRKVNVYAGATMEAMAKGGGHFDFTGVNHGNTAIIGHNRGNAGYFIFVKDLREGDIITLEAGGVTRSYAVAMTYTVSDSDFTPLLQYGDTRLTLVTCVENQRDQRRVAVAFEI